LLEAGNKGDLTLYYRLFYIGDLKNQNGGNKLQGIEANIQEIRRSMRLIREQLVELEELRSDHHKSSKTYTKINGALNMSRNSLILLKNPFN